MVYLNHMDPSTSNSVLPRTTLREEYVEMKTFSLSCFFLFVNFVRGFEAILPSDEEIEMRLKQLNKPANKTIMSENGDIIDCIDIYKQPSLDHPLLKNHTIEIGPSVIPDGIFRSPGKRKVPFQTWRKNGSCPKGTVPIIRKTKKDIINGIPYGSLGYYPTQPTTEEDEFAGAVSGPESNFPWYNGILADINIWGNPHIGFKEYSAASIGMIQMPSNWIRTGFMVNPVLLRDEKVRLFVAWKNEAGDGCLNDYCSGFVHVSEEVALGAESNTLSTYDGHQYDFPFLIYRDNVQRKWWMLADDYRVGYWPDRLFPSEFKLVANAEWTGIARNTRVGKQFSRTIMGSGHFAGEGYQKAAYFQRMKIINPTTMRAVRPNPLSFRMTDAICYDAKELEITPDDEGGLRIYYGGPGCIR